MPVIYIFNGMIMDISTDQNNTFITVTYRDYSSNMWNEQTVVLVVNPNTIVLNENGNMVPVSSLQIGIAINAVISSVMTRSNPPQANAYLIVVMRNATQQPGRPQPQPRPEDVTVGNIVNVDRNARSFTTVSDRNFSNIIRFNVSDDTRILDRAGRPINFSRLMPGMRVRVRHANFMTASIPPQTTAFEVQVL